MRDWMIRALKTLVQAFFGVLIPAASAISSAMFSRRFSRQATFGPFVNLVPPSREAIPSPSSRCNSLIL